MNWSKDKHKALSSYKGCDELNRLLNEMADYRFGAKMIFEFIF